LEANRRRRPAVRAGHASRPSGRRLADGNPDRPAQGSSIEQSRPVGAPSRDKGRAKLAEGRRFVSRCLPTRVPVQGPRADRGTDRHGSALSRRSRLPARLTREAPGEEEEPVAFAGGGAEAGGGAPPGTSTCIPCGTNCGLGRRRPWEEGRTQGGAVPDGGRLKTAYGRPLCSASCGAKPGVLVRPAGAGDHPGGGLSDIRGAGRVAAACFDAGPSGGWGGPTSPAVEVPDDDTRARGPRRFPGIATAAVEEVVKFIPSPAKEEVPRGAGAVRSSRDGRCTEAGAAEGSPSTGCLAAQDPPIGGAGR